MFNFKKSKLSVMATMVLAGALGLSSCTSGSDADEEYTGNLDSVGFSQVAIQSLKSNATEATSNSPLTQGFMVSLWKGFATSSQQTLMDMYEVKYLTDNWTGSYSWSYVGTTADGFSKEQRQTYWDTNKMPYRFYALTPYPTDVTGFVLSDTQLTLPLSAQFTYQTSTNGNISEGREDYLPAQVERQASGKDYDVMIDHGTKQINTGSTTLNRSVALPFHHFTSKVRFGIYTESIVSTEEALPVTDIVIKVVSDNFATSAMGYQANLSTGDMLSGSFTQLTRQNGVVLLTTDSSNANDNNILQANKDTKAYMMRCPEGLLQIPQSGVMLTISFKVGSKEFTDIPLTVTEGDETMTSFTWNPNTLYTYLIKVKDLVKADIECTATIEDWDYIYATINTDLEK